MKIVILIPQVSFKCTNTAKKRQNLKKCGSPPSSFFLSPLAYLLPQVCFFLYDVIDMSMANNT